MWSWLTAVAMASLSAARSGNPSSRACLLTRRHAKTLSVGKHTHDARAYDRRRGLSRTHLIHSEPQSGAEVTQTKSLPLGFPLFITVLAKKMGRELSADLGWCDASGGGQPCSQWRSAGFVGPHNISISSGFSSHPFAVTVTLRWTRDRPA